MGLYPADNRLVLNFIAVLIRNIFERFSDMI